MSKLDEVMEKFRASLEAAKTQEDQDKVSSKFEASIDAAFDADEAEINAKFDELDTVLQNEKKAHEEALEKQEASNVDDSKLSQIALDVKLLTQEQYAKKYKKVDVVAFAKESGVNSAGSEKAIVARIYQLLSNNEALTR